MCERTWGYVQVLNTTEVRTGPENTRGPRRLRGTLNPPGTAARSNIGRGVCGPGWPKDEEPGQSGQRAPDPPSAFLCGEDGSSCVHALYAFWTRPLRVSMRWSLFVVVSSAAATTGRYD
ncbi:hypothetical protein GCM10022403_076060 [Streptomyces coacervatus]|uniref:Uncharacterized protein n=1 Tax=Streptomyces coacervatus TaxID=647381 RepID=A0ABP7J0D1_9ACTN